MFRAAILWDEDLISREGGMRLHLTLLSEGYLTGQMPGRSHQALPLGNGEGTSEGNPSPENEALAQQFLPEEMLCLTCCIFCACTNPSA